MLKKLLKVNFCLFPELKRANGLKSVKGQSRADGGRNVRIPINSGKSPVDSSIGLLL